MIPILLDNKVSLVHRGGNIGITSSKCELSLFFVLTYKRYKGKIIETCKVSWVNDMKQVLKKEYIAMFEDSMRKCSLFFPILPS